MKLKEGQIVLCNLKANDGKKSFELKNVIFSRPYDKERLRLSILNTEDKRLIKKFGAENDLIITSIEIMKELGFKHKTNKYHEGTKSNEQRNTTTGAYD